MKSFAPSISEVIWVVDGLVVEGRGQVDLKDFEEAVDLPLRGN